MSSAISNSLTKIKMEPALYTYEQVIARQPQEGLLLGNVTTHLTLEDWVDMKGYTLIGFAGRRLAVNDEKTRLQKRTSSSSPPPSYPQTRMGMPAVNPSLPPPSSRRAMTIMGIPMPSNNGHNSIHPTPIKVIE